MVQKIFGNRIARKLTVALAALFLVSCGDDEEAGPVAKVSAAKPASKTPVGEVSKKIEAVTGAHTRIVWAQQQRPGKTDKHGNGTQFHLIGLDTRDGMGERQILPEKQSYNRPILCPDGDRIVFTDKDQEDKRKDGSRKMNPKCYVVNWDGSGLKLLRDGYAEDIWADPETGKFWVYALVDPKPVTGSASKAGGMIRFLLDDPKTVEKIWDKEISPNNVQVSADGSHMAGLFPWPYAGMLKNGEKDWKTIGRGCWTSISPDNSYLSWVFDGAHQNVTMVHPTKKNTTWMVPLTTLPDTKGREVYHPRWSNHPRIMIMTGPYMSSAKKTKGKEVEIYVGKFDPGMTEVSQWAQVTNEKLAEAFPDVWVSGGEQAFLSVEHLGEKGVKESDVANVKPTNDASVEEAVDGDEWPGAKDGAVFVWLDLKSENRASGRHSTVTIRGRARFTPFQGILLDAGWADVDEESAKAIQMIAEAPGVSYEMLVTPHASGDGQIYRDGQISIGVKDGKFVAQTPKGGMDLGAAEAGKAAHLAVVRDGGSWAAYRDGNEGTPLETAAPQTGAVRLGDGTWNGCIEAVAVFSGKPDTKRIAANAKFLLDEASKRKPADRYIVKGKLVVATAPRTKADIGAYRRAILVNKYEIVEGEIGTQKEVVVAHYYYMDEKFLEPTKERKVGEIYELIVEPKTQHPEMESELLNDDVLDFAAPIFFDVATPMP